MLNDSTDCVTLDQPLGLAPDSWHHRYEREHRAGLLGAAGVRVARVARRGRNPGSSPRRPPRVAIGIPSRYHHWLLRKHAVLRAALRLDRSRFRTPEGALACSTLNRGSPNPRLQRTRVRPTGGRSPLSRKPFGAPGLYEWAKVLVRPLVAVILISADAAIAQERDYDTPYFEAARIILLSRSRDPNHRLTSIREVVMRDAVRARPLLATLLTDPSVEVRREAAWWLGAYGDTRGLDIQAQCFADPACDGRDAALLLSVARRPEYAPVLRARVASLFISGVKGSTWQGPPVIASLRSYGTVALARIGAREDRDLVIDVVRSRPPYDNRLLEALGYLDDPRAADILWTAHKELLKEPKCDRAGLGIDALLPLSRLGDSAAIEKIKAILLGIGLPECPMMNGWPMLSADGSAVFGNLRSTDAKAFAETVFEVAARSPEGAGTREAWQALGMMHPRGFGERVLALAVSRRPHWKYVSRDVLNKVVIALDPALNSRFWSYFDVEAVPDMRGAKALVLEGLGRLNYQASHWWTSD